MKKILLLPLLDSLPSGHHQVANTISEYVYNRSNDIKCKKIDIMSRWNPAFESMLTKTYLWWIQKNPKSYARAYRKFVYQPDNQRTYKHYEWMFQRKMKDILDDENPDLIVCTHAFPSYLVNRLKRLGECQIPTLNVYTDFFINDVWGEDMVDYHFVSNVGMKYSLKNNHHIPNKNIFVTGIPVDESIKQATLNQRSNDKLNIIVSGGSAGLGSIMECIRHTNPYKQVNYYILCGNNERLYKDIRNMKAEHIHPLPYISSRQKINELYSLADAIITKPGGVTVSEAVKKRVPIFVHSVLPGQEEINLAHLLEQGLVFTIDKEAPITEQILEVLNSKEKMDKYKRSQKLYLDTLDFQDPDDIYHFIISILGSREKKLS
ncbi:MGDG synthase family glycosyltransferase [Tenuibacillus multivorans]|uniref:UDP-N-acetylglucosamine:LPS N-acetylglucosamine transferase n=1 Tax=Tenuibacillus multivorans TaxID=237069 RepID=A0A1H0ETK2_9BACI|nr:glycosyltransferase [Tenuibacillus multivorans]GEL76962.1 putative glycosyltransferase YkoN [Tenuibacillus multivorans]SDN85609.1 UDP-N-acetylglucosamine:LPS N-acetylglucosamine transferase [Tenuibacillus multivorans]